MKCSRRSGGSPCGPIYVPLSIIRRLEPTRRVSKVRKRFKIIDKGASRLKKKKKERCAKIRPSLPLYAVLKSDRTNICLVRCIETLPRLLIHKRKKKINRASNSTSQSIFSCRAKLRDRLPPICASLRKNVAETPFEKKENNRERRARGQYAGLNFRGIN